MPRATLPLHSAAAPLAAEQPPTNDGCEDAGGGVVPQARRQALSGEVAVVGLLQQ